MSSACLLAILHLALLATTPALGIGHYQGVSRAGRIDLHLAADGSATFGGAPFRWALSTDTLQLTPAHGAPLRLQVVPDERGLSLRGGGLGRIFLRPQAWPMPAPESASQPIDLGDAEAARALIGRWRHVASGGWVALSFHPDGTYQIDQGANDPQTSTSTSAGRWTVMGARLALTPEGGATLQYQVQHQAGGLLVSGGDLPMAVEFEHAPPL